ncbi:MFS transporter [Streptomyces sp. NPDC015184]|uniref:MFS transporter n=1 Tax=Streptomyces sp. NPDC015184 TaxID=3364946 RepID=UPI0036F810BF
MKPSAQAPAPPPIAPDDPDFYREPERAFGWLQEHSPVHPWGSAKGRPMYLVSRWADVRQVSASPAQFSSGRGHMIDQPRAVQGIGAAVLSPVSLTLLTSEFHDAKLRARALAAWGGVAEAAGAAGVFVGGLVTQYLNWRWTMLINVPIAFLVLVLARGTVAGRVRGTAWRTPDVVGALAVTGPGRLCPRCRAGPPTGARRGAGAARLLRGAGGPRSP